MIDDCANTNFNNQTFLFFADNNMCNDYTSLITVPSAISEVKS